MILGKVPSITKVGSTTLKEQHVRAAKIIQAIHSAEYYDQSMQVEHK